MKFDIRGDALLFNSLFQKVNTTVILSLFPFSIFFLPIPSYEESFTLYNFLLDYLHRTLVNHLNLYSSICLIKHLLWLSVNGSGWDYTVQGSSPHKCSQKSCCSAFNAMVAAFLLDISAFLPYSHLPEVYPYHWKLLEGHLSRPGTCLTGIRPIQKGQPPQTSALHPFLTWFFILWIL